MNRYTIAAQMCSAPTATKPIHDLLREVMVVGAPLAAAMLSVSVEFVLSWFPYARSDGKIEMGWEPSGGFIAAALAILRHENQSQSYR